jgi:uncharacterized RDD family membrane protein YckC
MTTPTPLNPSAKYTTIFRRILAYLIDSLFAFLVFVVAAQLLVFVPLRHLLIGSEDWFRSGWNTQVYTILTMSLPTWLYFALSEISPCGATLGKHLLKLKTVTKATQGKMTLLQSLVRGLVKLLPWEMAHLANNLPVPMWYDPDPGFRIAFLFSPILVSVYIALAFLTKERQSLHDLAARTVVIHSEQQPK